MLRYLWISLLIIIADQFTKLLVQATFVEYEVMTLLPVFDLTLVYNTGAAFSFLSDAGWQRWFFVILAVVVSLVLVGWIWRLPQERVVAWALAMVIGGAVGNLIDRVAYGKVVDFLSAHWNEYYWPAFNVADSFIVIGVILLLWDGVIGEKRRAAD